MSAQNNTLPFEQEMNRLEAELKELERTNAHSAESEEQIRQLRRRWTEVTRDVYSNLTAWETVLVARYKDRPQTVNYLDLVFDEFVELHGARHFGDDRAMRVGFAKLDHFKVMVIGHQKGQDLKQRSECFFGCAHPEGYRKALLKMKLGAKFGMPIICLIDTPGAYPGIGAEERGQAQAIAENMYEMSRLDTRIICVVIGEGGSGGALGIGLGDRVAMLEHSYYSVISPEGCAGILWKSHEYAEKAANALRFTSRDLPGFGVVDDVIEAPLGGAPRDHFMTASRVKNYLVKTLRELEEIPNDELLEKRYEKFRRMGVFLEEEAALGEG